MNSLNKMGRRALGASLALGAFQLAACASAPLKPVAAPPPALAAPAVVTMAPIPNPVGSVHERRPPTHTPVAASDAKREKAAAPATPPAPPARDPVKAARLRARGLEELDRGAVTRAVALLTQASQLDPASALIHHDLERAERIARAVHASK